VEAVDEACHWTLALLSKVAVVGIAIAGTSCGVCVLCYFAIKHCCKPNESDTPGGGNKEGAAVSVSVAVAVAVDVASAPVTDIDQQQNIQIMQPAIQVK